MKRCIYCDYAINDNDAVCPSCGNNQYGSNIQIDMKNVNRTKMKPKHAIAAILSIFAVVGFQIGMYFLANNNKKQKSTPQMSYSSVQSFDSSQTSTNSSIHINDFYIFKTKRGKYHFVVEYDFTNKADTPKAFMFTVDDQVFYNGIECTHTFDDYDGSEAGGYDEVMSGKTARVVVGYEISNFNPDEKYEFTIRLAKAFDEKNVLFEDTFTRNIQIKYEKVDV